MDSDHYLTFIGREKAVSKKTLQLYTTTMGDTVSTLLFQPPPPTKLKENKIIWLKTPHGKRIPGFYIHYGNYDGEYVSRSLTVKELQATDTSEGITILYSHANAEDLGSIYPWCKFLSKMLKVNLFAYDYTGYGMAYDQGKLKESRLSIHFRKHNHNKEADG